MATRSFIGIFNGDPHKDEQSITGAPCHFDGYAGGVLASFIRTVARSQGQYVGGLAELIISNPLGWSSLTGTDGVEDRLPPLWPERQSIYGENVVEAHVRKTVYARWNEISNAHLSGREVIPQSCIDESLRNIYPGSPVKDTVVIVVHDNETYEVVDTVTITQRENKRLWQLAYYWVREGMSSYMERGEYIKWPASDPRTSFSFVATSDAEWLYVFHPKENAIWAYQVPIWSDSKEMRPSEPWAIVRFEGETVAIEFFRKNGDQTSALDAPPKRVKVTGKNLSAIEHALGG